MSVEGPFWPAARLIEAAESSIRGGTTQETWMVADLEAAQPGPARTKQRKMFNRTILRFIDGVLLDDGGPTALSRHTVWGF